MSLTKETWFQLCQLAATWDSSTILQAQQHLRQCETQVKLSSQPWLWLEICVLGLLPNALPTPASNTTKTLATIAPLDRQPWSKWKTPDDALAWGQQQLPHLTEETLQKHWNTLKPINGKKAVAWVEKINNLATNSTTII